MLACLCVWDKVQIWIFCSKMKITQADAPTIRIDCHSIMTNWCPNLCHPHHFYAGCPSWYNPPNLSWLGTGTKYAGLHTWWLGWLNYKKTKEINDMMDITVLHYNKAVDAPWSRISRFQLTMLTLTLLSEKSNAVLAYCTNCHVHTQQHHNAQHTTHCRNMRCTCCHSKMQKQHWIFDYLSVNWNVHFTGHNWQLYGVLSSLCNALMLHNTAMVSCDISLISFVNNLSVLTQYQLVTDGLTNR